MLQVFMSLTTLTTMTGVPLEVMLRFNRLKALTTDEAVVAAALRKSSSGLMEVKTEECIFSRLVWITHLQCFDAVGWAAGRASGL